MPLTDAKARLVEVPKDGKTVHILWLREGKKVIVILRVPPRFPSRFTPTAVVNPSFVSRDFTPGELEVSTVVALHHNTMPGDHDKRGIVETW